MKLRTIKNFGKHFITVTVDIPDEVSVVIHQDFAEHIEAIMSAIRDKHIKNDNNE